jgi:hypothetical protein
MNSPKIPEEKKIPTNLTELDFEIFSNQGGKEYAIRVMRIISAIRQERLARKTTN